MDPRFLSLVNEFLSLEHTYDTEVMRALQEKFEKYLKDGKDTADKQIENTIYLLKGLINFEETNNIKSSYKLILPMLNNLEFGMNMELIRGNYNRKLLIMSIPICESYEQAFRFLNAIEDNFVFYSKGADVEENFKRRMYIRITNRLLRAKGFEQLSEEELAEVEELFTEYAKKAKMLCVDTKYFNYFAILAAREGLFYGQKDTIDSGLYLARSRREAKLNNYLDRSLNQYRALPTLIDDPLTEKEKFGIMLRELRLAREINLEDFAKMTGFSPGTIRILEHGEDKVRPETLKKICETLGITEDYFKRDISIVYKKATE